MVNFSFVPPSGTDCQSVLLRGMWDGLSIRPTTHSTWDGLAIRPTGRPTLRHTPIRVQPTKGEPIAGTSPLKGRHGEDCCRCTGCIDTNAPRRGQCDQSSL